MKILYLITQSELGGAQKYILDLASYFQKENDVLVCSGEEKENKWFEENLSKNNIKYLAIKNLKRDISPLKDIKAFLEIRSVIKKFKPDIVHLNSTKISILGSLASVFIWKTKVVYTAHGWVFNENLSTKKKRFYTLLEKYTTHLKEKIICVSDYDKNSAIKIGIKKQKLTTIYNGILNINYLSRDEARLKLNKIINHKINDNDYLIGTIGNLYKNKGFLYLINAIKSVTLNFPDIKLIIIGEGEEKEKLEKVIKEKGMENNIFLCGKIENASNLMKAFDLYINSSIKEGLSYTILEAMQAKLPIIVTDVGGNPEMIKNRINGIVIKSKKSEDMAEKIIYLLNNKNKADLFAMNNKEKLKFFNYNKMLEKTSNIYKTLTQQ